MTNLYERFFQLSEEQKYLVHIYLCEEALKVWRSHVNRHAPISYVDSLVALKHIVENDLPQMALQCVKINGDGSAISQRYVEPIVAMQDHDLEFPDHIEFAYYAIYNLFRKYIKNENIDDWLIVNQALSSQLAEDRYRPLLIAAIDAAITTQN